MNRALLEPILYSTNFPEMLEVLNRAWENEQRRRHEFWADISDDVKAEFIAGEALYHTPVTKRHNRISLWLIVQLDTHIEQHSLGYLGFEKVMCRFTRNDYEPDICFWTHEKSQSFTPEQTVFPVPDFIVEILSPSTEGRDRGVKFEDYESHGVSEYWIIDPEEETIEQYVLREGKYHLSQKLKSGILASGVIAGFSVAVEAIFG